MISFRKIKTLFLIVESNQPKEESKKLKDASQALFIDD